MVSLEVQGMRCSYTIFFFQAEDGIRDYKVTGVQTCALPICVALVQIGNGLFTSGHLILTLAQLCRLRIKGTLRADRKSTRLNSSHLVISYAVFCLKKKKKK